ncbi:MAG TPA: 4-hydroxy-tetrahydrodipicolinate synthase [Chloroflexota bacterium]|nr:4-hydroxy-tetrahydrodipicolinate synthase [Chloroflexota bacterium]
MATFGRVLTAMATPFTSAGEVDYPRARQLALALLDSGTDGLVVTGTTGESPTLSTDEKLRLYAEVKEAVGSRAPVIAGTCNYNTAESIHLSLEAKKAGADAILGTVPYYNKPTQEGLYQHFKTIAEAVPLPMILYNVPTRTVTNMAPDTTIRLSEVENIIGIKEASGNFDGISKIIQRSRSGFQVWSGDDGSTLPILSMGGYGIVSVASHLVGKQIQKMISQFLAGDVASAARMHRDMLPLVNALFVITSPIPLKYALKKVGFDAGPLRLPLIWIDPKSAGVVDEALSSATIDLPVQG